jgi:hypothetical protein
MKATQHELVVLEYMRHMEIRNGIKVTLRLALSTLKDCLLHTSMPACVRNGTELKRLATAHYACCFR